MTTSKWHVSHSQGGCFINENFELSLREMNNEVEMMSQRKRKRKSFSKKSNFPEKGVSCNWINFLNTDGKSFRNSLRFDTENETKETAKRAVYKVERVIKASQTREKSNQSKSSQEFSRRREPAVTKVLAIDCEMVSDINNKDMLGRVSIVNYKLQCLYDNFVKPTMPVGDYRTRVSGIREEDLKNGIDFDTMHKEVKYLLRNKIIVGHALRNDFKVLNLNHNRKLIRDTSKYEKFIEAGDGKTPSLKKLAKLLLGENIQEGEHSSVEDAKTAMKLYIKYRHEWEAKYLNTSDRSMILNVKQK